MSVWGRVGACPERSRRDPARASAARQFVVRGGRQSNGGLLISIAFHSPSCARPDSWGRLSHVDRAIFHLVLADCARLDSWQKTPSNRNLSSATRSRILPNL